MMVARKFGVKIQKQSKFQRLRTAFQKNRPKDNSANPDNQGWNGPQLGHNILMVPPLVRRIKSISLGESHLVALCEET